jgi:hypothetical protein
MEQQPKTNLDEDSSTKAEDTACEGEGEEVKHTTVAIKPTKTNKMSALSRIKIIQENDWKTWKGPDVKHSGRPGTSGLIKSRSHKDPHRLQIKDDLRFKSLLKIMMKLHSASGQPSHKCSR